MISDRERRNDAVYAEHKAAVAAGEKRVLRNTSTGELHSYPADEIGFTPGSGQAQVSTWWGMGILAVVAAVLTAFSVVMLLAPLGQGQSPMWGALFLTAGGGAFTFYALTLSRQEYRATQLRKLRGSPKPNSTGRADYWEPPQQPPEPPTKAKTKVKSLDDYIYDIHNRPSNGGTPFFDRFSSGRRGRTRLCDSAIQPALAWRAAMGPGLHSIALRGGLGLVAPSLPETARCEDQSLVPGLRRRPRRAPVTFCSAK